MKVITRLAKIASRLIGWLLLAVLVVFCIWAVIATAEGRLGCVAGVLLGTLLGPARVAGVGFRQWFRDPGTPSEISDNSPIGLMRGGFHALSFTGAAAFICLIFALSLSEATSCPALYVSLPSFLPSSVADFLGACGGLLVAFKLIGSAIVGIALMETIVKATWRFGLTFRLLIPPPPVTNISQRNQRRNFVQKQKRRALAG